MAENHEQSFLMLVAQIEFGALVGLGVLENPASGTKKREVRQAEIFIDQLEMLRAKTQGNLSEAESRTLEESLHRLRMAFVETGKKGESAAGADEKPTEAP
jgi:hypothetical protein